MHATIITAWTPPVATLTIVGELDIAGRGDLARRLDDLAQLECTTVRLDVGRLTHIDGRSLHLIDETRKRIEGNGGSLQVIAASLCFALLSAVGGFTAVAAAAAAAGSQPVDSGMGSTERRRCRVGRQRSV